MIQRGLFARIAKRLAEIGCRKRRGLPRSRAVEAGSDDEPRDHASFEAAEGGYPARATSPDCGPRTAAITAHSESPWTRGSRGVATTAARRQTCTLAHEETPEFVEYWRAIMLRKWSILALAMLVAVITAVAVSRMVPVYRSTATLLIETDRVKLVPIGDASERRRRRYYREYFQTQAEVLKSREVAERVVTKLKLAEHQEFDPRRSEAVVAREVGGRALPRVEGAHSGSRLAVLDEASVEAEVLKRFAESPVHRPRAPEPVDQGEFRRPGRQAGRCGGQRHRTGLHPGGP